MTRRPPPKQAGPVRHDDTQGMLNVVITYRKAGWRHDSVVYRQFMEAELCQYDGIVGLDVAVTVVGAQGEASEFEEWPPGSGQLSTAEDVERVATRTDTDTIQPKGGRL